MEVDPPTRHLGALAHGREPEVPGLGGDVHRIEADAVVADPHEVPLPVGFQLHIEPGGLRVLAGVRQSLVGDPIQDRARLDGDLSEQLVANVQSGRITPGRSLFWMGCPLQDLGGGRLSDSGDDKVTR